MSEVTPELSGPDLVNGIALSTIADGAMLLGHAHGEPALLARWGDELFAIGNVCTHYGAPLNEGLLVDDTVRCPWHHACFSLRTGAALRAPALNPVSCWRVERRDGTVYVREKIENTRERAPLSAATGVPGVDRDCRRWRGGQCRCRNAPSGRLPRPCHPAERR